HGVARRERTRSSQLLARLECYVADLSRCGVNLIECARTVGKDLDGVEIPCPPRLDARGIVGRRYSIRRFFGFFIPPLAPARRRPGRRDMQRTRLVVHQCGQFGRRRNILIVSSLWWLEGRAAAKCESEKRG